jgi:tRNA dimethylallyltransferase
MKAKKKPSILVILGPTASGKSDLAVVLAKKLNGEVVSADSRQVYKSLDIGSGKITKKEMKGVPHHLLDVVSPSKRFTVDNFQKKAYEAIDGIIARGKLPIVCGGTGFYIQSVVDGTILPDVTADIKLRAKLAKLTAAKLFAMLKKLDPKRAKEIDMNNKVRMIRSIEIAKTLGKVPKLKTKPRYDALQIGISFPDEVLKERIRIRLEKRIRKGMIREAINLHKKGLSWKRMEELGLEYRFLAQYLQGKITKEEMISLLSMAIWHYAKRQMGWFKRDGRVWWVSAN